MNISNLYFKTFNFTMDSQRSCCSSFMCCGMSIQKGCFVFSIINAVICSLASLGSLCFLIVTLRPWFDGESRGPNDMVLVYLTTGITLAGFVAASIALTFAVVLCVGVRRNNKGYVMAYLVYGIITLGLSVVGTLGFIWLGRGLIMYALIPLGMCVLYTGILVLVHQTYEVILELERSPAVHGNLLKHDY